MEHFSSSSENLQEGSRNIRRQMTKEQVEQLKKELFNYRVKESCEVLEKPTWKLFLDDERFPVDETMIIARSYDEAKAYVLTKGCPIYISFDHDLGVDVFGKVAKSGFDFTKWLVEEDIKNDIIPGDFSFYVHSMNPIGKKNIEDYINGYLAFKKRENDSK